MNIGAVSWRAMTLPSGNSACSSPTRNSARPRTTYIRPIADRRGWVSGRRSTKAWKPNRMTAIGTRSNSVSHSVEPSAPIPPIAVPHTAMPKTRTKIIGVRLAKAISPKPSIIGLRPRIADERPMPSAATSGTVTVDVVTPPAS